MELVCTKIEMKNWERRDTFLYFNKMMPSAYSLTVDVDVTELVEYKKANNTSFFAMCLWAASRAVNEIPDFMYNYTHKELIRYNFMMPMFPIFHEDTQTCTMICIDPCQSYPSFEQEFNELVAQAKKTKKFVTTKLPTPPPNVFNISMEHRIHFNNCTLVHAVNPEKPVLYPIFVFGKYDKKDGRCYLPVAIQVNHAIADGYHASVFYNRFRDIVLHPDVYFCEFNETL